MPRNASGTYSLPVAAYVAGTTIVAAQMNTNLSDIGTALTQSLATTGVSGMTGPVKLAAGTLGAPSLSLVSDVTTGWYNNAAGSMTYVSVGVAVLGLSGSGASLTGAMTISTSLQVGTTLIVGSTTTMQGVQTIAVAGNTAVFRNTTNNTSVNTLITFQQGSGAGNAATIRAIGTGANDITGIFGYINTTAVWGYDASSFAHNTYIDILEVATPGTPSAAVGRLFMFDDGSNTRLAFKNDAGVISYIAPAGSVIGSAFGSYALSTGLTGNIPSDDTIPQTTEGDLIISQAYTIKNANSRIRLRFNGTCSNTLSNATMIIALFDSFTGANAVASQMCLNASSTNSRIPMNITWEYAAPTTGAVTFTVRSGASGGTYVFNGDTTGRFLGGSMHATLTIEEIQQ